MTALACLVQSELSSSLALHHDGLVPVQGRRSTSASRMTELRKLAVVQVPLEVCVSSLMSMLATCAEAYLAASGCPSGQLN